MISGHQSLLPFPNHHLGLYLIGVMQKRRIQILDDISNVVSFLRFAFEVMPKFPEIRAKVGLDFLPDCLWEP